MKLNTTRFALTTTLVVVIIGSLVNTSDAVPVFARKYGFECTMCHSNFPRLNDFGQRYRNNGYQLPGRENEEKTVLETPTPVALRTSAGYNFNIYSNAGEPNLRQFQVNGLDLLSGGLIDQNIGYFLIYPPQVAESEGIAGQEGTIEMANVIFSNLFDSRWLNIRVGRFEPAYVPFSVKRSLSVAPYEVYDFAFSGGSAFSETQNGLEITGFGRCGLAYACGVVSGAPSNPQDEINTDFYARVSKILGAGEGQTAGQRIGIMGYYGSVKSVAGQDEDKRFGYMRFGVDASVNFSLFNLGVQYLMMQDKKELWDTGSDATIHGGFAELSIMPMTKFVSFWRFDMLDTPDDIDQDVTRFTVGGRYHFKPNLACHLEYSRKTIKNGAGDDDITDDFATLRLDLAF